MKRCKDVFGRIFDIDQSREGVYSVYVDGEIRGQVHATCIEHAAEDWAGGKSYLIGETSERTWDEIAGQEQEEFVTCSDNI